jgi:hypothetical protein
LKYESERKNSKVGQENTDSIGLNTENDVVRFGYFSSIFILNCKRQNPTAGTGRAMEDGLMAHAVPDRTFSFSLFL